MRSRRLEPFNQKEEQTFGLLGSRSWAHFTKERKSNMESINSCVNAPTVNVCVENGLNVCVVQEGSEWIRRQGLAG
jgi:hypothetical protein